ncbi:MAG: FAD-binding protein [Calditrichae bacterium]|nr:FAD-binding protein [Calditrichota bacterium]MCB9057799.1 FAD-binding protein [Calditrichia bacterium]
MDKNTLLKIKQIVGTSNYLDSDEDKIVYSYDGTPMLSHKPQAVVMPESPSQISEILKLANSEKFAVVPRGSGTGLSGGAVAVENSIIMLMHKWDKILEIDEENLTAWVQPGVKTYDFHQAVEQKGLFYPPDPGSQKICTLGGNVAENAGGLRGLKYGVTRDYVMAVEMVLPNGEILINGGKNVKDVAGYNLRDLIVGSEGTLGIFTKILLRLLPKPKSSKTILAFFSSLQDAAKSVSDIIAAHIIPCTMEFLDSTTIKCVEDFAKIGLPTNVDALLLLESDGHPEQVADEAEKMYEILKRNNATEIKVAQDAQEADQLKTARRAAFSALARVKPTTILEDATVPRSNLAPLIKKVSELAQKYNLMVGNFGHAGDGNMHPTVLTDERNKEELERVEKFFDELYDETIRLGGTITGEHGVGLAKKKYLKRLIDSSSLKMMQDIKKAIDPNNILNPGKIFSV